MFELKSRLLATAVTFAALMISGAALAQTVDTNRPGFSFSPNVVADGQWQLETGIAYTRLDSDSSTRALPLAELRVGLSNNLELFVSSLGWMETESGNSSNSGLTDVTVGTKIGITENTGATQMAVLFQLSVPVGGSSVTSDRFDPSLAFVWAHSGEFSLAGTVKVSEFESGFQLENGLKLPFSLGNSHSAFVEWEAILPDGGGDRHWLNGGYQWLIDNRKQIDINVGLGLNDEAGDYRLGMGFSVLF